MADKITLCLYDQKPIKSGRADKKFCNSVCKDAYYNAIKLEEHAAIKKVDVILKRNRRILKKAFNPNKDDVLIKREALIKAGFEFDFHTHLIVTKFQRNEFIFCYDYGYREVAKEKYKIIKSFK